MEIVLVTAKTDDDDTGDDKSNSNEDNDKSIIQITMAK